MSREALLVFWQRSQVWLAEALSLLGGLLFFWRARYFAHAQLSIVDEGSYLYKGLLFVTGQYRPFQDYGPWTNHMPLSFIIPGAVQLWFGPGLRTARYFSIVLAMLALLGVWIVARRLGGRWWALAAVWAVALNPTYARAYSSGVAQGLVFFLLVWVLVLVLGEGRPLWQLILGTALAAILMMTRINLAPVVALVTIYVFWRHGPRAGWFSMFTGVTLVLGLHALYWPDILKIWAGQLANIEVLKRLTPFLSPWRVSFHGSRSLNLQISGQGRLVSVFIGLRAHFVSLVGVLFAGILWNRRQEWQDRGKYKDILLLWSIFISLFVLHAWASLSNNYCVYCFDSYLSFFSPLGFFIAILTFTNSAYPEKLRSGLYRFTTLLVFLLFAGVAIGAAEDLRAFILHVQAYRIQKAPSWPDPIILLRNVSASLGLSEPVFIKTLAAFLGIASAVGFVFLVTQIHKYLQKQRKDHLSFTSILFPGILILGFVLTPTKLLGGAGSFETCGQDVITSYEEVGEHLMNSVPPGVKIFWNGGFSVVPLLYIPDRVVYPPQLNGSYSLVKEGDPQELLKFGRWSRQIAADWLQDADYLLAEHATFGYFFSGIEENGLYTFQSATPSVAGCGPGGEILIYRSQHLSE